MMSLGGCAARRRWVGWVLVGAVCVGAAGWWWAEQRGGQAAETAGAGSGAAKVEAKAETEAGKGRMGGEVAPGQAGGEGGGVDAREVLETVLEMPEGAERVGLLRLALLEWARTDGRAAWGWVRARERDEQAWRETEELRRALLGEWAKTDPALALELVEEAVRGGPPRATALIEEVMAAWAGAGRAKELPSLFESGLGRVEGVRQDLIRAGLGAWAEQDAAGAARWVDGLGAGADRDVAVLKLAAGWAERDGAAALAWVAALPADGMRSTALMQATQAWAGRDPLAAGEWLAGAALDADFDGALAALATAPAVLDKHLETAMRWAETIEHEADRAHAWAAILEREARRDAGAARQRLAGLARGGEGAPPLPEWAVKQIQERIDGMAAEGVEVK